MKLSSAPERSEAIYRVEIPLAAFYSFLELTPPPTLSPLSVSIVSQSLFAYVNLRSGTITLKRDGVPPSGYVGHTVGELIILTNSPWSFTA